MARRRNRFQFTGKSHSKKGIIVCLHNVVLLVLFCIFISLSYGNTGNLSIYYGAAGFLAMIVSLLMLIFSVQCNFEEDSFPFFPRLALALSVLAVICWGGSYGVGLGIF